jgi:lipid-A-disaccharide synthase
MRIMFVAGENSGDHHAGRLIEEMNALQPGIECFGYGGTRMEAAGMHLEENLAQKLPIIGISQVARHYGKLKQLFARAVAMLAERKPDLLVLVDYPGFNLRLACSAADMGIPVVYYISPQVWAWKHGRIKTIARTVKHMLVILPFEEQIYRDEGVPVTYVGHPLCDLPAPARDRTQVARDLGIDPGQKIIGLLPGSRRSEVVRHLPVMLSAARIIRQKIPGAVFVVPQAATVPRSLVEKYFSRYPDLQVFLEEQDTRSACAAMDFAVCKSGTSTLEMALLGVPMIIVYKVSLPTIIFAKIVVRIPWIGLVNIVANELICPELIQSKATAPGIARAVLDYMENPERLERMRSKLDQVRARIGRPGASRRAAEAVLKTLNELKG